MALGGYKFAGRYCQKGTLTNTEWALLMHKTKLAAFMASNSASNAGWSFDQTGGDVSFSTYGNVIYSLDSVGNNYVSFFVNGDVYLAILTCCLWGASADAGTGKIKGPFDLISSYSSSPFICSKGSAYHRLSKVRLTTDNIFTNINGACGLYISGMSACVSNSNSGCDYSKSDCYPYKSSYYQGYAMKEKCVLSFSGTNSTSSEIHLSVVGGSTFSSFANDNDTNGILCTLPYGYYSGTGNSVGEATETNLSYDIRTADAPSLSIKDDGTISMCAVSLPLNAAYASLNQQTVYPFSSVQVYVYNNTTSGVYLKGNTKIDFLSCCYVTTNTMVRYQTVANGNYIFAFDLAGTMSISDNSHAASFYKYTVNNLKGLLFVGWDPSNPDITSSAAWELYE